MDEHKEKICIHNKEVNCTKHNCVNCGWNPTVEEERKKNMVMLPRFYKKKVKE